MTSRALLCVQTLLVWIGILGALHVHAEPLHITAGFFQQLDDRGYPPIAFTLTPQDIRDEWQPVTLPHAMPRRVLPPEAESAGTDPLTTVTWYRLPVPKHEWDGVARYLYIPRIKMDGMVSVYVNRQLLYQKDSNVQWNGANTPLWIALDKNTPTEPLSEILVRVQHPRLSGGGLTSIWIGTHEEIYWRYQLRMLVQVELAYAFSSAFLAVGIFSLFVWFRLREEPGYLLFFLFSFAAFVRTLHYHVGVNKLPVSDPWLTWMTVNSLFWVLLILHNFLNHLHQQRTRWLDRTILCIVVLANVGTLPLTAQWFDAYDMAPFSYTGLLFVGSAASVYGLRQSIRAHSSDGRLLAIWGLLSMALGIHDMFLLQNLMSIESIYLAPLSNIGAFVILMGIVYRRYLAKHDEVIAINASLQDRLSAREKELEKSHQRLRKIELQSQLEQERQRLMQDMHDGMGSNLRTALLTVEKGNLSPAALADVLKDCIDDLKLTIDSMEPMESDLLLLLATFRYRVSSRLESAGIALRWNITSLPKVNGLTPQATLHILRICQEAFTNIIKHSGATEISVATQVQDNHVSVIIADNGHGFSDAIPHAGDGRGMNNLKRRAEFIGATIDWQTSSSGTQLTLTLPIGHPT